MKAIESVVDGWRMVCYAYGIVKACDSGKHCRTTSLSAKRRSQMNAPRLHQAVLDDPILGSAALFPLFIIFALYLVRHQLHNTKI